MRWVGALACAVVLAACSQSPWNDPYPAGAISKNVLFSSFSERPKHLDPAQSYSSNEVVFTGQVYEPPLEYHYLKRPYVLEPLTATHMPTPYYLDARGHRLGPHPPADKIAYTVYEIHIKPGIYYQPHPAFAKDANGKPLYLNVSRADLEGIHSLTDFKHTGTRELVAADYVYEIKRLAEPRVQCPILGVMSEYIVGLKDYAAKLQKIAKANAQAGHPDAYIDLTRYPLEGAEVVDRYTYRIKVKGRYPQLRYWLAMPFFAPVPPEADRFYSQPGMAERNITLDWWPVGTGPYMLSVNNPNRQMVLVRNPNYRKDDLYPSEGEPGDAEKGLLADAGKPMPFIDKAVYSLEKESIPRWNKFLQGYYDISGITSDSFDQAIQFSGSGNVELTDAMRKRDIKLVTSVQASIYYMGFNMLDPVVGGYSKRARKVRQAISIALNYEDYIAIFLNGRGIPAQGPIPPGIFGHRKGRAGIDPYVYDWVHGQPQRKSIAYAKQLLAQAGYPNGRDAKTGKPLLIHLDITASGPEDKSMLDWFRKEFRHLGLQLVIRNTDYNRFQDKMRNGNAQLFMWGWNADYPDPENFLFLLYGPNGKVKYHGENAANYNNPEFNRLFVQMKDMQDGPKRQAIIDKMVAIAQRDAPWVWGFFPQDFVLYHDWYKNAVPNLMANNTLKYKRIDPKLRARDVRAWNRPLVEPLLALAVLLAISLVPAIVTYRRREHRPALEEGKNSR
ncbi:MAG TPA: ABC transporter substrate-binding protein [Gammaproteobacteria bacterium]|nr:ABC transporter substrate-binding protein [Gammaproteobacteria bacterium]